MTSGRRVRIAIAVAALVMGGCSGPPADDELPGVELPTVRGDFGACAGIGMGTLILAGRPDLQPPALARWGSQLIPIAWPRGYRAVFDPALKVLDERGVVVAREGDDMTDGSVWPDLFICPTRVQIDVVRRADLAP